MNSMARMPEILEPIGRRFFAEESVTVKGEVHFFSRQLWEGLLSLVWRGGVSGCEFCQWCWLWLLVWELK